MRIFACNFNLWLRVTIVINIVMDSIYDRGSSHRFYCFSLVPYLILDTFRTMFYCEMPICYLVCGTQCFWYFFPSPLQFIFVGSVWCLSFFDAYSLRSQRKFKGKWHPMVFFKVRFCVPHMRLFTLIFAVSTNSFVLPEFYLFRYLNVNWKSW